MAVLMPAKDGCITLQAYAAVTQYCGVSLDINGALDMKVTKAVEAGKGLLGVAMNTAAAGEEVTIFIGPGICPAYASSTVTQGKLVNPETGPTGQFEHATNGEPAMGMAMTSATDGEQFDLYVNGIIIASAVANYNAQ